MDDARRRWEEGGREGVRSSDRSSSRVWRHFARARRTGGDARGRRRARRARGRAGGDAPRRFLSGWSRPWREARERGRGTACEEARARATVCFRARERRARRRVDLDQFVVWRVEWQQPLHIGVSVWNNDGMIPIEVLLSYVPDIGPGNEEKYEPIDGVPE